MQAQVHSVESIFYNINKKNPPEVVICAIGEVPTSGWTNGKLTPWMYVVPPEDGIQDFSFIANAPLDISLSVITPITGGITWVQSDWMKGIRIHSSTNSIEVKFDSKTNMVESCLINDSGMPIVSQKQAKA